MLLDADGAAGSECKTANFWDSILCKPNFLTGSESNTIRVAPSGRGRCFNKGVGGGIEEANLARPTLGKPDVAVFIDNQVVGDSIGGRDGPLLPTRRAPRCESTNGIAVGLGEPDMAT